MSKVTLDYVRPLAGMQPFTESFKPKRKLLVGGDGIAIDEFLSKPVEHWVR